MKAHEATHIRQQKEIGKDVWWERYFKDKDFRLSQEVEAYRNQVSFIRSTYGRQQRRVRERKLVKDMNRMYGNMCSKKQAECLIIN